MIVVTCKKKDSPVSICCSERFRINAPNEIVAILAEEGTYVASEATIYCV